MVIYENIKVIESAIEVNGTKLVIENHSVVRFQGSHAQYNSMAIVWRSVREFYSIMITYSSEHHFELKYP